MLATRLIQSHKTYLPSSAHTSLTGFPSSLTPVGQRRFVNVLKYLRENAKTHFAKNTVEDFERGNLWELHQISASCGRPFDPQFLQEPKPLPEELLWGYNLVDKDTTDVRHQLFKNPVNLVIFTQKRLMSEFQINSWRHPMREIYPNLPIFEILLPQNWLYIMLNFEANRRIKASLPPEEWKNIIYLSGGSNLNLKPRKLGIDIENSYLAYAFLVDKHAKYWWRAGGKANTKDLVDLCLLHDHLAGAIEPPPARVYEKLLNESASNNPKSK